ncbi:MAG: hypothetical protein ACFFBD_12635 [Candidatus Hodarchaeota archaeon]
MSDDPILSLLVSEWSRKERIQRKLEAPNLAFAILKRFREVYRAPIGTKVKLVGMLTKQGNQFFIEMPPRELLCFYPKVQTQLILPVRFGKLIPPPKGIMTTFSGTINAFSYSELLPSSPIKCQKFLAVDDWDYDYRDAYLDCPISLDEILKMIREKFEPQYPLDLALLFSPISAPSPFNTMGGVSTLLSAPTLRSSEIIDIGRFLQNLTPSWHHGVSKAGFSFPLYKKLTPQLSTTLKVRKNAKLEFSPLIVRSGAIDLERESTFFELDDPLVLERSTIAFNERFKEFETFLPEIQWSVMCSHLWMPEITEEDLPPSFDKAYEQWVEKMRDTFPFFNKLYISDPSSLFEINGRRGGLIRLTGSLARLKESLISKEIITEVFDIATKLFSEFNLAHASTFEQYERDPQSPYYGQTKSRKVRHWQTAIFDIIRSQGFITRKQTAEEAEKFNLTQKQWNNLLEEMVTAGKLYEFRPNKFKML